MSKDTGGPAFPVARDDAFPKDSVAGSPKPGMTLRDYFATHADVPWAAAAETFEIKHGHRPTVAELAGYVADIRHVMADAMLAERAK